jgi:Mrp family chromosome partitioning ATPase
MEQIRQAVERAKEAQSVSTMPRPPSAQTFAPSPGVIKSSAPSATSPLNEFVLLNPKHLEANRIISYDVTDHRARSYDMLRTQVLQSMAVSEWHMLAITSPSPACGKTVTAINLALSIARQPDKPVLLIDFDLQRPKIGTYLGLKPAQGVLSLLEGRTKFRDIVVNARVADSQLTVLPCETSTLRSSELIASRAMTELLQEIKQAFKNWTVIVDLPPILAGDEVISILPQLDCVLFVAAAGTSTAPQVKECVRHLESTPVVRMVLNKSAESHQSDYSRYNER